MKNEKGFRRMQSEVDLNILNKKIDSVAKKLNNIIEIYEGINRIVTKNEKELNILRLAIREIDSKVDYIMRSL